MKRIVVYIRVAVLTILGIYVLLLSTFLIVSCFQLCFFKHVIKVYEYIGMVAFIIADIIVYIFIFRYFMIQKVYDIKLTGKKQIILKTQFKDVYIMQYNILDKSLSYLKSYRIKVEYNGKIRIFFVPYKLMDMICK